MERLITEFLRKKKIGKESNYKNLTIFPIISEEGKEHPFITIDTALDNRLVEVTEMSDIGDVPNLRLKNLSDDKIFILDGEELIGAKQNRVTNSVVLVPEKEELVIPVSCVERNRWNYKTKRFSSGHNRVYSRLRKKIFVSELNNKQRKVKHHPQHDVWTDIDDKMTKMKVDSTTSAMNDIYKKHMKQLEKFRGKILKKDKQIGMVVIINNKVTNCEIFSNHKTFEKLYNKILNSYIIDAIEEDKRKVKKLKTIRRKALGFLNDIKKSKFSESAAIGLGKDTFCDSDKVCGSGLSYDDKIVYMSVYSKADQ